MTATEHPSPRDMPHRRFTGPTWSIRRVRDDVHILPVSDEVEHEMTADCICGPAWTLIEGDEGMSRYVHSALDGRRGYGEGWTA